MERLSTEDVVLKPTLISLKAKPPTGVWGGARNERLNVGLQRAFGGRVPNGGLVLEPQSNSSYNFSYVF